MSNLPFKFLGSLIVATVMTLGCIEDGTGPDPDAASDEADVHALTQTWMLVEENGNTATLAVDSNGNFTGTGWSGTAPGCSDYSIPTTDGRMSGTSMTFDMSASYCNGQGTISGSCIGMLDTSFPSATSASGTCSGTISDPLGTRAFNISWTASGTSGSDVSDTTPPSAPTGLACSAISAAEIECSWSASTDSEGVEGYHVHRDGEQVGSPTNTSYTDAGLSPSTQYCYAVSANDTAGNTSDRSSEHCAQTQPPPGTGLLDRGNGLIYDPDLDITYYDFSFGPTSWSAASDWANNLVFGGFDDWRLPKMRDASPNFDQNCSFNSFFDASGSADRGWNKASSELGHLFYEELDGVPLFDEAAVCDFGSPNPNPGLVNGTGPFQNLQFAAAYWTSTPEFSASHHWNFGLSHGGQGTSINNPTEGGYAIAVRDGDVRSTDPGDQEQLDVSGVWTAPLDGGVINNEDGGGETTEITLTLVQSGTEVTGTAAFTDTRGRSGSSALSGTLIGDSLSVTFADFDAQCDGRTVTMVGTVTSTTPGSTMSLEFSAEAKGNCRPLPDPSDPSSLTYTKR